MDIDTMPDCRLKYQIIVERAKAGKGRFVDAQFAQDDSCLGNYRDEIADVDIDWKSL